MNQLMINHEILPRDSVVLLDGAMGTMLQKAGMPLGVRPESWNLTHPEAIEAIHRSYVEAGSRILYTNTFGANAHKLKGTGLDVREVISKAVKIARRAAENKALVALDIGPIGEMLAPNGTLPFTAACDIFKDMVVAGKEAGADLIIIETMTDLLEVKAAILAARENTDLPVFVTMTFEEGGRTFEGTPLEAMVSLVEGMGCAAVGINCSLGPREITPFVRRLKELTQLPIIVKANAGLPNLETGSYDLDAESYARESLETLLSGVAYIGGCCGTDPSFIRVLHEEIRRLPKEIRGTLQKEHIIASSGTGALLAGRVHVTGERLNPTGKKRFQQALVDEELDYILKQALEQAEAGADLLDVNVGHPGVDEERVLPLVVQAIQSVSSLPLQLDTTRPSAMEAALRVYNGKAVVNSVNGKDSSLESILPLVKKYGASVIALPLDDDGIPETPEGRLAVIDKIIAHTDALGIQRKDVILDALTMTVSAQGDSALVTLQTMDLVRHRYGLLTTLGVSNISFGAPDRPTLNLAFLSMALDHGLDLALINPNQEAMMLMISARRVLLNQDPDMKDYLAITAQLTQQREAAASSSRTSLNNDQNQTAPEGNDFQKQLSRAIGQGLKAEAGLLAEEMLKKWEPNALVEAVIIPTLDQVGKDFEKGSLFLPQLIASATAAQEAFEQIKNKMAKENHRKLSRGSIILATVKGDIHDIGKNIVKVVLENYGYDIIDLGRDVPVERVVERTREKDIRLVGLSALMTTTLDSMDETIRALRKHCPDTKIMVGGAVLTRKYALNSLNADFYTKDATESVAVARQIFGGDA